MTAPSPSSTPPQGPAPADLVIRDLIVGDGAEAKPGDTVTVHYAGVEYDSGEEFDSSWNRGESIQFPLRGLIQGWQDGIPGMKVGGRRELVIPPAPGLRPRRRPLPRRQDPDLRHRPHRGRLRPHPRGRMPRRSGARPFRAAPAEEFFHSRE